MGRNICTVTLYLLGRTTTMSVIESGRPQGQLEAHRQASTWQLSPNCRILSIFFNSILNFLQAWVLASWTKRHTIVRV
ncbi:uncharacterized protein EDB93DRAFT_1165128 [Suillus bovinus]|uniref:uncharacterized protein n=1 Tax=Suillus bovinus TaxID=48563 RepID=UPI001B877241|nr:uncharacterized protein EDB93DRAFT_1165128 [Suillus bovinus]KAG2138625.1 hypothetical protein EDB93DRAFT_1165128 [Suillus bovinus]